ncbi:hypothetical protein FOZ76_02895 [Verticiella sediminum]|uniref:DUF5666 domain-containing protein n=1 Tax=Verticiella sediminum TaxID=1247510 RepID=A0A556AZH0_9BURK|nr:DUF6152 family protein [Verticiella sediminum]TSH98314.1 hypothetical protein FOZ76_02895 [Verticiella sediminum]
MSLASTRAAMALAAALACAHAPSALAHHGWAWAEGEQTTLAGTVEQISMAPPHPTLRVKAADGELWQVDLGNPSQTQRSGFTAETTQVGAPIEILGNRSAEPGKPHMKAVRITVGGQHYDMYPERIKQP